MQKKKSAYILWLHSNVLAELLHALWTHHIVTTYFKQTSRQRSHIIASTAHAEMKTYTTDQRLNVNKPRTHSMMM